MRADSKLSNFHKKLEMLALMPGISSGLVWMVWMCDPWSWVMLLLQCPDDAQARS